MCYINVRISCGSWVSKRKNDQCTHTIIQVCLRYYNDRRCFFWTHFSPLSYLSIAHSLLFFWARCTPPLFTLTLCCVCVCVLPTGGNANWHGYEQHLTTPPWGFASVCACVRVRVWVRVMGWQCWQQALASSRQQRSIFFNWNDL